MKADFKQKYGKKWSYHSKQLEKEYLSYVSLQNKTNEVLIADRESE
jgi:hypothetical protein